MRMGLWLVIFGVLFVSAQFGLAVSQGYGAAQGAPGRAERNGILLDAAWNGNVDQIKVGWPKQVV